MEKETRFEKLIQQQQESGLTIKDFCFNQGIAPSTFHYWRKKIGNSKQEKGFIPLVVKPSNSTMPCRSNHSSRPGTNENDALLELVYPNGTCLRIKQDLDLDHLRSLIRLFD